MDIYRVHVSLREIEPAIWRRIELSSQTTLKQLHRILQIAMGWENCHLHEYIVDGRRYGTADPAYDGPGEIIRETGVRLATVLPGPGAEILYVYDFGDYWQHDVRLEAVFPAESRIKYPRVLDGSRSCPPETAADRAAMLICLKSSWTQRMRSLGTCANGLACGSTRRYSPSMPQMSVC
jgi:hypothetical protein